MLILTGDIVLYDAHDGTLLGVVKAASVGEDPASAGTPLHLIKWFWSKERTYLGQEHKLNDGNLTVVGSVVSLGVKEEELESL